MKDVSFISSMSCSQHLGGGCPEIPVGAGDSLAHSLVGISSFFGTFSAMEKVQALSKEHFLLSEDSIKNLKG